MRKLCTILAALALVALCAIMIPTEAQAAEITSGTCGDNLTWTLDDAGTLTISGTGAMSSYPPGMYTPWMDYAESVTSIVIKDGVTTIGYGAFSGFANLTSVSIPASVTNVGIRAFANCTGLYNVFYCGTDEQWSAIVFGTGNTCLTDAQRSNHDWVDATCTMPKTCTICGAIEGKPLGHIWPDIVCTEPKICTICGADGGIVAHNVTTSGICSLCQKYGTCGDNLVWTLDNEGTLTISGTGDMKDYTNIYTNVYFDCWFGSSAPWYFRYESPYFGYVKAVVIKDGVTSIGQQAFSGLVNLAKITIPDSVTSIGECAFSACDSLKEIDLPDGVTSICKCTFQGCTNLTNIIIPGNVTSIGAWAFDSCSSLTSVAIPNSMKSIGSNAFSSCTSLAEVTYCGTAEQWNQISIELGNTALKNVRHNAHAWTSVTVAKEPTYVALGEQVSTCGLCGEQKTEPIPAKFYGTSVNLGNTLDMYFGFYTGLVDENGTVKFVREFADGTTETTETPITSFKKNNSVYDITYTGLAAKEMCDTIHVYVYNGEGTLVGQHSDSIRSYILRQLREKEYGQEFRTLCIDLLNYGAAAQETFGYNTGDLANKDLTAEELAEGTQTVAAYTNKQAVKGNTAAYYGTAYLLETKISMTMAVRGSYFGNGCYALVSYTDHTGTEKNNIRLEGKINNSVYEFVLNEIVVADGRCLLTIEFYKADGTKVLTVQDSMESYTARNADIYPLAEKMLAFSDSAYNYLHRNDQ